MERERELAGIPKIAIIMGSDSDLPVMAEGARLLEELGLESELTIVSAHRTPQRMVDYAVQAVERGIGVIIAGAGGAAHLPGMVAALTTLPVIGVPIRTSSLNGLDSLLSIVQMPAGIPVATVAINNARNAALLACRVLSVGRPPLRQLLEEYAASLQERVLEKATTLEREGFEGYLASQRAGDTPR